MEFRHLAISVLFTLALAGSHVHASASLPAQDYWHSLWPNTPIPNALQDFLHPVSKVKQVEDTQYPSTFFLERDFQPGRKMNLHFNKHKYAQPWGVSTWTNDKQNDAYDEINKVEDTKYPSSFFFEHDLQAGKKMNLHFNKHRYAQPWGVFTWTNDKQNEASDEISKVEDTQYPSNFFFEHDLQAGKKMNLHFNKHRYAQPWGVFTWTNDKQNEASDEINKVEDTQYPSNFFFEHDLQAGKKMNLHFNKHRYAQPWGVSTWTNDKQNEASDEINKVEDTQYPSNFFFEHDLQAGKKMNLHFNKHRYAQPWGVSSWTNDKQNEASDEINKVEDTQYPSSFFFEHDLQAGKKMNLHFNKHRYAQPWGVSTWTNDKQNEAYDEINVPDKVKDIDAKSLLESRRFTLEELCEKKAPVVGEEKICAKSLESLVDFVISKLGKDIQVLSGSFVPHQDQYNILEGVHKVADDGVMCHKLNFETVVFHCHQVNATSAYTVPLVAADGTQTKALAVCHHDTRGINPVVLYQDLKVKPGTVPVCHFLGPEALLWVPNLVLNKAY